jgi:multicomponent Na+:H+ antiporter subunit E
VAWKFWPLFAAVIVARRFFRGICRLGFLHLSGHISFFYCWLVGKIILSNIDVVKRIWLGNKSISPCVARLPLSQKTDMGKVIYANSITLTPGTVSMDIEGTTVLVHALTAENIAELKDGEMNRRVADLEL